MTIRAILLCIATSTIATSELSKMMDPTVDPCENFYDFACGRFVKSKPVNVNFDYMYAVQYQIHEDVAKLIAADIKPNELESFKLVKKFYKSCVNKVAIEARGLSSIRIHLQDLGGWPVVEGNNWNEGKFNWGRNINTFKRTKNGEYHISDGLSHCAIKHSLVNPSVSYVMLGFPDGTILFHKRQNAQEERSFLRNYRDTLIDIAIMLGANNARAMIEVSEIISFERKLAEIVLPKLKLISEEKESKEMTIAQLKIKYPSVPWTAYVQKCVEFSISVTDETIIVVPDPEYYVELEALMATTSKRVQANYVMSRIALEAALFSTKNMRTIAYRMQTFRPSKDRAGYCVNEAMHHLWQGVAAMYADKFLDKETKDAVKAIVENLKWQVNVKLIAYNLPGKTAWNLTSDKIAGLVTDIGYPDEVVDQSKLYENLQFTEDDYFGNMVRLFNYNHKLGIKQVAPHSSEIDKWRNLCGPVESDTISSCWRNSIYIAVGNLRGRYFGKDHPKFMNYGALGRIVGHEMTHLFFENGIVKKECNNYASYCGLRWTPAFASRAQCLIDQYESYQIDDTGIKALRGVIFSIHNFLRRTKNKFSSIYIRIPRELDGKKTLSENLADVGGVKLAYDAYTGWAEVWPEEPKLPGLEQYSAKQMFWISAAAIQCQKITPEQIRYSIRNDEYTIGKFRVIGMLSNVPEFAKDFNCKAISLMNPAKRCDIWQSE